MSAFLQLSRKRYSYFQETSSNYWPNFSTFGRILHVTVRTLYFNDFRVQRVTKFKDSNERVHKIKTLSIYQLTRTFRTVFLLSFLILILTTTSSPWVYHDLSRLARNPTFPSCRRKGLSTSPCGPPDDSWCYQNNNKKCVMIRTFFFF